jgi:membrane-associated phospholipid phosphatase
MYRQKEKALVEFSYMASGEGNFRLLYKKRTQISKFGRILMLIIFFCFICTYASGQEQTNENKNEKVPFLMVFHNFGWNILHSITCNYGINFVGAGLATFISVESGLDWKWSRLAYNNGWMPKIGNYTNYVGYAVPVLSPLILYLTGRFTNNYKLQIAGLALTQSIMLTLLIQVPMKVLTGRTQPGIVNGWDSPNSRRSDRTDNYSREFKGFSLDFVGGWPSGHAAHAFSAAATIAQIYHDILWLKIAVYSYASLLSLGMSMYDHWASDVFAGALIGLAIGTTVGKSYRNLIEKKEDKIMLYATSNSLGVIIRK